MKLKQLDEYYNASCSVCRSKFTPSSNYVCCKVTKFPEKFSAFRCINLDEEEQHPFWEPRIKSKRKYARKRKTSATIYPMAQQRT